MHILPIIVLGVCYFFFLFCLHALTLDDFVFFKKHITTERVFNIAFLTAGVSLFSARLVYVFFHLSLAFLNPLVFFLFPYFPGLSLGGSIIGGLLFLFLYIRSQKLPFARFVDFFALSFLCAFPIGLLAQIFTTKKPFDHIVLTGGIVIAFIFFVFCVRLFQKKRMQEGSSGILSLPVIVIVAFVTGFVGKTEQVLFFLSRDDFLLIGIFIVSLIILFRQENVLGKIRK